MREACNVLSIESKETHLIGATIDVVVGTNFWVEHLGVLSTQDKGARPAKKIAQ